MAPEVLLIAGNDDNACPLFDALRTKDRLPFEVVCVPDVATGLITLEHDEIDCVVVDVAPMSARDAQQATERLVEAAAAAPVIVLTGVGDPETGVAAVALGARDHLSRLDLDPELLIRVIESAIDRRRGEVALSEAHDRLARLEDRERIGRDLHDTVIQQLFATGMGLQALAVNVDDPGLRDGLLEAVEGIDLGITQLREAIFGLQTYDPAKQRSIVEEVERIARGERAALGFTVTSTIEHGIDSIGPSVRHDLLSTISEALANVAKHARATATHVTVRHEGPDVVLEVVDNGIGYTDLTEATDGRSGHGLANMERRATEFSLVANPDGGSCLTWRTAANAR